MVFGPQNPMVWVLGHFGKDLGIQDLGAQGALRVGMRDLVCKV